MYNVHVCALCDVPGFIPYPTLSAESVGGYIFVSLRRDFLGIIVADSYMFVQLVYIYIVHVHYSFLEELVHPHIILLPHCNV